MPIVEIEIVLKPGEKISENQTIATANKLGELFGSKPGGTWIKVRVLEPEFYSENGMGKEKVNPIFVKILKGQRPQPGTLKSEIEQVVNTISNIYDRHRENVHIIYEEDGAGRVAFGGKFVE